MDSQNIKTKIQTTKNPAMRVKPPHRFIPSSTRRSGQTKKKLKKQNKNPTSSRGGARYRRHPFERHYLAEEDD